jgi:hypothetical protein
VEKYTIMIEQKGIKKVSSHSYGWNSPGNEHTAVVAEKGMGVAMVWLDKKQKAERCGTREKSVYSVLILLFTILKHHDGPNELYASERFK